MNAPTYIVKMRVFSGREHPKPGARGSGRAIWSAWVTLRSLPTEGEAREDVRRMQDRQIGMREYAIHYRGKKLPDDPFPRRPLIQSPISL